MGMRIDGLNSHQLRMLNTIWACRDEAQFLSWYMELSPMEQLVAESLIRILQHEYLESYLIADQNYTEAKEIIERIKSK
jgi:hypothetical protein